MKIESKFYNLEKLQCRYCGGNFLRTTKKRRCRKLLSKVGLSVRKMNSVCCSVDCSRYYADGKKKVYQLGLKESKLLPVLEIGVFSY